MNLEEALNFPYQKWEAMSDEEILKYFEPALKITRPELAEKPVKHNTTRSINSTLNTSKRSKANAILAQLGLDIRV